VQPNPFRSFFTDDVIWGSGTQFDLHDQPATVSFAAHHAIDHLSKTLAR
jgi:SnoaL-like protein